MTYFLRDEIESLINRQVDEVIADADDFESPRRNGKVRNE